VQFIAAGSAACHCIIGDVDGRCFTWGRNEVLLAHAITDSLQLLLLQTSGALSLPQVNTPERAHAMCRKDSSAMVTWCNEMCPPLSTGWPT
jgi:hypothetical protein